jgi:uncharacterized membrane protein YheB (UPF0754 family)
MPVWAPFIIFPLVGALIGAITNQIAIKMLFRPYAPIKLGSWKLPFTPGVIPAQRHEIAKNIASTFEANLLSGEEIHTIVTGPRARAALEKKVDEFFAELGVIAAMFASKKPEIIERIMAGIEEMADEIVSQGGELHIGEKIEARINAMEIRELEELVLGFSRKQFRHITIFGGILGFVIGVVQALILYFV